MLNAPSGVTRTAGAYMYATKLANSPMSTVRFTKEKLSMIYVDISSTVKESS